MPLKASKFNFFTNLQIHQIFQKTSILEHLEAFFGHSEENKKVLELNFTPENTPRQAFWVHFERFSKI